ncbi:MAG: adenylate/guanylate cyclase domain-containing protein [Desulfobacteraceae bacterium]|nr:MAG: adenylate/guanylate cyclase domain-containing protein [Desulfobacteraceae bacterium]
MPRIRFLPDEKSVDAAPGITILDAARNGGVDHECTCGGNGCCTTCRLLIVEGLRFCGNRTPDEEKVLGPLCPDPSIRLACQTTVSGDVTVRRLVIDEEDNRLVNALFAGATPISGVSEREVAILFADIRDFTPFSESINSYDVLHVLNRYFHRMARVIERHGGYVDNYMGDGLLALFGVEDSTDAAIRSVRAGRAMLEEIERFQPYLEMMYKRRFRIGIGIHYGRAVIGVLGACNRQRKTAIGDAVNLASRIEGANKHFKTSFLISEDLLRKVDRFVKARPLAPLELKGKSSRYTLYEVLDVR